MSKTLYFYNQNSYGHISYDKPDGTKATIKSGGCGVCSACIVVNTLLQKEKYNVEQMAKFSITNKARTNDGTDEIVLLNALCSKIDGLKYKTTNDIKELTTHLKNGGMAICNQGNKYNIFSTSGHYVVAYGLEDGNIKVADPSNTATKYDKYDRPKRIVKKTAYGCVVKPSEMKKATADRYPSYYLVSYSKPKYNKPNVKAGKTYTFTTEPYVYKNTKKEPFKISEITELNSTEKARHKKGTKANVLEVLTVNKNVWIKFTCYKKVAYALVYNYEKDKAYIK
jgi:hypothetical protein